MWSFCAELQKLLDTCEYYILIGYFHVVDDINIIRMINTREIIETLSGSPVRERKLSVERIHDNPIEIHTNSLKKIYDKDIEEARSKKHRLNHCGHSDGEWRELVVIVSPRAPEDRDNKGSNTHKAKKQDVHLFSFLSWTNNIISNKKNSVMRFSSSQFLHKCRRLELWRFCEEPP